jgi:hypothetical protein
MIRAADEEAWSYCAFPEEHRPRIRTRVVGAFSDRQSAVSLVAGRLRHIAGRVAKAAVLLVRGRFDSIPRRTSLYVRFLVQILFF